MRKNIIVLGSTGSIGATTLSIIKKNKSKFNIKLLSTKQNAKKVLKQALLFNVNNVIIEDKNKYNKFKSLFKKKKNKSSSWN